MKATYEDHIRRRRRSARALCSGYRRGGGADHSRSSILRRSATAAVLLAAMLSRYWCCSAATRDGRSRRTCCCGSRRRAGAGARHLCRRAARLLLLLLLLRHSQLLRSRGIENATPSPVLSDLCTHRHNVVVRSDSQDYEQQRGKQEGDWNKCGRRMGRERGGGGGERGGFSVRDERIRYEPLRCIVVRLTHNTHARTFFHRLRPSAS